MVLGRQQLSESWTWQVLRGRTVKVPGGIIKCVHSAHPFLMTWHCYNGPLEIARPKASENGISDKSDFREFHIWNKNRTSILLKGSSWNCALERFWKKSGPVLPAKVRVSVCVSLWVSHGWVTTKKKTKKNTSQTSTGLNSFQHPPPLWALQMAQMAEVVGGFSHLSCELSETHSSWETVQRPNNKKRLIRATL